MTRETMTVAKFAALCGDTTDEPLRALSQATTRMLVALDTYTQRVVTMRRAQGEYFKAKTKDALLAAKEAERQVDEYTQSLLVALTSKRDYSQVLPTEGER